MTLRVVLATANPDKAEEIAAVVRDLGVDLELEARPAWLPETSETGDTLAANARLKAREVCAATGQSSIADDTGLEVDALGGEPGVRSARFAGEDATYADNVTRLLERLAEVPSERRSARFVTVAACCWPDGHEFEAIGSVEGTITTEARGTGGFGYDPVFVPDEGDGRTFAEMSPSEKRACSHRTRAFRTLAEEIRQDSAGKGMTSGRY
jgi:XTP/dITP diphosphohydrolase